LYLRVSTKEQAMRAGDPEGYSLPTQREACLRKAQSLGAVVVDEYLDKDTGTLVDKRPAMQELLPGWPKIGTSTMSSFTNSTVWPATGWTTPA